MRLNFGKLIAVALVGASPAAFSAAHAQAVGMQIVDTSGAPVGTVTAIKGDNVQVKTDKHEVLLPKASFRVDKDKLVIAMTQAQLDSKIEETAAANDKAIVAGATVNGLQGTEIGKIDSVTDSGVVIALSSGKKIQVARNGVRGNADGSVTVGLTSEQIEAATKQADATAPASAPAPSGK
jgi:preprotein translocase subunit YajC